MLINHVLTGEKLREKRKVHRESLLEKGFVYGLDGTDYVIKSNLEGRSSVAARAAAINSRKALNLVIPNVEWKTVNKGLVLFTPDQFLMLAVKLDEWVEDIRKRSWE